jgi:hypothetical protein
MSRAAARELDMIRVGTTRVNVVIPTYLRGDLPRLSAKSTFCLSFLSCLDGADCAALMGSDAGKLSFRPF